MVSWRGSKSRLKRRTSLISTCQHNCQNSDIDMDEVESGHLLILLPRQVEVVLLIASGAIAVVLVERLHHLLFQLLRRLQKLMS